MPGLWLSSLHSRKLAQCVCSAPMTTATSTWLTTASAPRRALPSGEGADVNFNTICLCVWKLEAIWKPECTLCRELICFTVIAKKTDWTWRQWYTDKLTMQHWCLEVAVAASVHVTDTILMQSWNITVFMAHTLQHKICIPHAVKKVISTCFRSSSRWLGQNKSAPLTVWLFIPPCVTPSTLVM